MISPPVEEAPPTEEPFYAPDFALPMLEGGELRLSEMQGQWVVLNFWATWCAPCLAEMPALNTLHNETAELRVIGVNLREEAEIIRPFVERLDLRFPILIDPPDAVVLAYNITSLPQTFVINPAGVVVWRQFGPLELAGFRDLLASLGATLN